MGGKTGGLDWLIVRTDVFRLSYQLDTGEILNYQETSLKLHKDAAHKHLEAC